MKSKTLRGWALAIASCFMGSAVARPPSADEDAAAQALRLMYVALTKEDTAQLRAVTTSDFYGFDGGRIQFFHSTRVPARDK